MISILPAEGRKPQSNPSAQPRLWLLCAAVIGGPLVTLALVIEDFHHAGFPETLGILIAILYPGVLIASFALLSLELAWGGNRTFAWRLLSYLGWLGAIGAALVIPMVVSLLAFSPRSISSQDFAFLPIIPSLLICSQLPLWTVRYFLQCRLLPVEEVAMVREAWTIRDFLCGTFLVAAALAPLQWTSLAQVQNGDDKMIMLSYVLVTLLFSLVLLLPAAWYFLRSGASATIPDWATGHMAILFVAIVIGVPILVRDEVAGVIFVAIGIMSLFIGYLLLTVYVGLGALRKSGLRLFHGKEPR